MGYKEIQKQIDTLEKEVAATKEDVSAIKTYVTNHIPHILDELKVSVSEGLKSLDNRIKPFETRNTKMAGVSEFLTVLLKAMTALAALTWTVIQIARYFIH